MRFSNSLVVKMLKEVQYTLKRYFCFKKILLGILVLITVQFYVGFIYGLARANQSNNSDAVFELFPTDNIWTFLKLNTRNGWVTQVQYDVNENNRMEVDLNITPLVETDKEQNGRFTLYHTKNMYNFILLDQIDGRTWQVQWSDKKEERLVLPIYSYPIK